MRFLAKNLKTNLRKKFEPMKLPIRLTETDVLKVIETVAEILAPSFVFGYYTIQDIKQEVFVMAIDGLDRYDHTKNDHIVCNKERLARFLSRHVRNRLLNLKRAKYFRYEKPKDESQIALWEEKNHFRRNLMHPQDISSIADEELFDPHAFGEELDYQELIEKIRRELPDHIYNDYQRMLSGVLLSDSRRLAVQDEVQKIIDATQE